jgi:hypothetical protein
MNIFFFNLKKYKLNYKNKNSKMFSKLYEWYNSITFIANISYMIYRYNLLFYVIYLLLIKRSYIEAFFIIYNFFR